MTFSRLGSPPSALSMSLSGSLGPSPGAAMPPGAIRISRSIRSGRRVATRTEVAPPRELPTKLALSMPRPSSAAAMVSPRKVKNEPSITGLSDWP
ncbi:hypothetical protein D3C85_1376140 [compost metagenome]